MKKRSLIRWKFFVHIIDKMPFYPRRRRLALGGRRRKPAAGTRVYRKKRFLRQYGRVQSRVHMIKRLGKPAYIQNDAISGQPVLSATAGGSMFQTTPVAGQLPQTWESGFSAQFQLNSTIDFTDMTQLFDRYKIVGVKLKFQYLANAGTPISTANLPTLHYAFDGDDSAGPVAPNDVLSKAYCKTRVLNANIPTSVYYKPRVSKELYISPGVYGETSERPCWIDCNNPQVPHFGMKMWLADWLGGVDNNNAIRIQPTYYLAFKDTQ